MSETCLQVARRMREDDFSDDEIRAELHRRAELGDWAPDDVQNAVSDSRWTTSVELQTAVGDGDKDALAATVDRGILMDLLTSEATALLLTADEELEAVSDPDAVLNRHGIVAGTGVAGKQDAALALLRRRAAEDPRRSLQAARAVQGRGAVSSHEPPRIAVPRTAPRARSRRERRVARATSSSDSGSSGEGDGDGDPPPPGLLHALRPLGLSLDQVRWCRRCGTFAFAIDAYQRAQLDALGFTTTCPNCKARP
jgi:hypothetical protein